SSRKIHVAPEAAPDLAVPLREITLSPESGEAPVRVYDASGPYTDNTVEIDVNRGLPRLREAWIAERGGTERYDGRITKPEDNGNVSERHAARTFPLTHQPLRGLPDKP